MKSVNVAELKNGLSRYLKEVRAGEEIIVNERNLPVAKIIPFHQDQSDDVELLALAAEGKITLPEKKLPKSFWELPTPKISMKKALTALRADRDED
jgi:prevent-host-death family protein